MKGQEVKEILQQNDYSLKDVASLMGETPQNFQAMLKVEDIKTGVLERIAKAINKNIMFFFPEVAAIKDSDEISITNEIARNQTQIYFLYQRIVDVEILITDYLKVKEEIDYIGNAAAIMNSMIWDKSMKWEENGLENKYESMKLVKWQEYNMSEKRIYCLETREAVASLKDIFFDRFNVLYKKIRKFDF